MGLVESIDAETQALVQPCNNFLPVEGCILNGVVDTTKTLATCVIDPTLADQEAVYCYACDSDDGCHLAQYSTNKPNAVVRRRYDNTPLKICTTYLPESEGCVVNDNVETSITKDQCVPGMTSIVSDRKEYTYCEGAGATYYRKESSFVPSLKHICNTKIPDETDAGCVEHDGNDYYMSQRSKDECTPDWTTSNEKVFLYCDNCNSEAGCDIGKHWHYEEKGYIVLAPNCGAFPPDANDATTHYCLTNNPIGKDNIAPGVSHDMQTTNIISLIFDHDDAVKVCTLTASAYWCDGSLESVEASSTGVPQHIRNQIIAGITKEEVPASVVEAIEAEVAAEATEGALSDFKNSATAMQAQYQSISKQCESWGV